MESLVEAGQRMQTSISDVATEEPTSARELRLVKWSVTLLLVHSFCREPDNSIH